ncbi:MAG TPA: 50S ribosomal protein L18Ae [Candidatus Thermoplasmatota archaeon]|nr:50S ribosomal protein L18Ae [Candidatus Thermoplasmatota archaeon]
MTNKAYQVEGDFQMGRVRQHFVLQVVAKDEKAAADRVHATLGSRHSVTRRQISIASTKAISGDEISDASAKVEMRGAAKGDKGHGEKGHEKPHAEKGDKADKGHK